MIDIQDPKPKIIRAARTISAALIFLATPSWGGSGTCAVPAEHASIQEAVDDVSCSIVTVSPGRYPEVVRIDRSLHLEAVTPGSVVIEGRLQATGSSTEVELRDLRIESGCPGSALFSSAGARIATQNIEALLSSAFPCSVEVVFRDGFESGDTSGWSGMGNREPYRSSPPL